MDANTGADLREACPQASQNTIRIEKSWLPYIQKKNKKPYMKELKQFLANELKQGKVIYPHGDHIFEAFNATPFDNVKVVILGQDPYHGPGQAHGMCFSVRPGVKQPPSLKNIFKELHQDLGTSIPSHGYLMDWAKQGVFLLNTVLTVEQGKAGSHRKKGWEDFTDKVITTINQEKEHLFFLLWGSTAQKKEALIDGEKHTVLKAPHPSPLSAHRGFFGCRHFSKANDDLKNHGLEPINWQLSKEV